MSERILQHVLEDLRPTILPKLQAESDTGGTASAKKATVETHRGENYHFCYFLRKTQPHSIVVKTRSFTTVPRKSGPMPPPPVPEKLTAKRKTSATKSSSHKKKKRKVREEDVYSDGDGDEDLSSGRDEMLDDDSDVVMEEGPEDADFEPNSRIKTVQFTLVPEEQEEKPKPVLHLKYKGFSIFGNCLCIVVEPWPPIRALSRAPSIFRATPVPPLRVSSIAPPEFVSAVEARTRSKTPLFLPDIDDYERGATPFPNSQGPLSPGIVEDEDEDDYGGMMQFSQVLNSTGDHRAGAIDEDEDMEGAVLFGDADEYREL
ncbi:hypothetical protein E1B28_004250 [Marasmius oreades]|nr:uncharacterized protein E1B28_004250 [Marasmius oreades]KAG7096841.1 hypothetical protein E1B28_004250 [Marasmius oreades]